MQLVGVLIWFVGALIKMFWAYGIRSYVRSVQGLSQQTVNQTMMFTLPDFRAHFRLFPFSSSVDGSCWFCTRHAFPRLPSFSAVSTWQDIWCVLHRANAETGNWFNQSL